MVVSALIFGAIAVAVRSGGGDGGDEISGPAERLPAVVTAAQELLGTVPPEQTIADELGRAYGEATLGFDDFAETGDDLAFAERFDRLPDAEARVLGRSLGEMQSQLSPSEVDGARGADDRAGDIIFGLQLSRAAIQTMEPEATRGSRRWPSCRSPCRISRGSTRSPTCWPRVTCKDWRLASTTPCPTQEPLSWSARWPMRSVSGSRPSTMSTTPPRFSTDTTRATRS